MQIRCKNILSFNHLEMDSEEKCEQRAREKKSRYRYDTVEK